MDKTAAYSHQQLLRALGFNWFRIAEIDIGQNLDMANVQEVAPASAAATEVETTSCTALAKVLCAAKPALPMRQT